MSDAERTVQRDIQANARLMQKRRTSDQVHDGKGGVNGKVGQFVSDTLFLLAFIFK